MIGRRSSDVSLESLGWLCTTAVSARRVLQWYDTGVIEDLEAVDFDAPLCTLASTGLLVLLFKAQARRRGVGSKHKVSTSVPGV